MLGASLAEMGWLGRFRVPLLLGDHVVDRRQGFLLDRTISQASTSSRRRRRAAITAAPSPVSLV